MSYMHVLACIQSFLACALKGARKNWATNDNEHTEPPETDFKIPFCNKKK